MKTLSWNCKRAKGASPVWDYINSQEVDIVLLQEVWELPDDFAGIFPYIIKRTPVTKEWNLQKFHNVIASKYPIWQEILLESDIERMSQELKHFKNNIFGYEILLSDEKKLNVVLVYSPARPVSDERMKQVDTDNIRSRNNPDVYLSDILRYSLKHKDISKWLWLIWGDFNLSVSFDKRVKWWRGNQHSIERMQDLWLHECIVRYNWYTPTFRHSRWWIVDQIDHIFVSDELVNKSLWCNVDVQCLTDKISDHAPVIVELEL